MRTSDDANLYIKTDVLTPPENPPINIAEYRDNLSYRILKNAVIFDGRFQILEFRNSQCLVLHTRTSELRWLSTYNEFAAWKNSLIFRGMESPFS